ncbi:hypothetical protein ACSBR2_034932 [Camellia fascicularis]
MVAPNATSSFTYHVSNCLKRSTTLSIPNTLSPSLTVLQLVPVGPPVMPAVSIPLTTASTVSGVIFV